MILIEQYAPWYTHRVFECQHCRSLVMPDTGENFFVLVYPENVFNLFRRPSIEAECPGCHLPDAEFVLLPEDREKAVKEKFGDGLYQQGVEILRQRIATDGSAGS